MPKRVSTGKYKNKKTMVGHILFDSKAEAAYYEFLLEQKERGVIVDFSLQPVFLLQAAFKKMGRTIRKAEYIADFLVEYPDGQKIVVDIKGVQTDVFKLKAKLFDRLYPDLELQVLKLEKKEWVNQRQRGKGLEKKKRQEKGERR